MQPLVDLVVVTYNAPGELMNFCLSLEKYADVPFTLSVVNNNASHGHLKHVVERWMWKAGDTRQFFLEHYKYHGANIGYARACNMAASKVSAPYLILLNDDVMFTAGCLSKLLANFERPDYEDVGIIGPRQVGSDGRLTHAGIITVKGKDQHRFWHAADYGQANDEFDAPTVAGSVYAIRREVWDELTDCPVYQAVAPGAEGAFLPTQHYYEETWASYHARNHGWRVRYQGDVPFIHQWHRSSPVGGIAESTWFKESEALFRKACHEHEIPLEF